MRVRELVRLLRKQDQDATVVTRVVVNGVSHVWLEPEVELSGNWVVVGEPRRSSGPRVVPNPR